MKKKIVTSDKTGMTRIITESGRRLYITSKPCPSALFTIPVNVILIAEPELLIKFKILPLRNNNESKVVNKK